MIFLFHSSLALEFHGGDFELREGTLAEASKQIEVNGEVVDREDGIGTASPSGPTRSAWTAFFFFGTQGGISLRASSTGPAHSRALVHLKKKTVVLSMTQNELLLLGLRPTVSPQRIAEEPHAWEMRRKLVG